MAVKLARVRQTIRMHVRRGSVFLIVGVGGAVVDLALFNGLVYWQGDGPMSGHPVTAKVIAILVATVATYFGNALLTYRDQPNRLTMRRAVVYAAINVGAIGIQTTCLYVSRYVLGFDGVVADNVSGSLIGLVLASAFRYIAYGRWVFSGMQQGISEKEIVLASWPGHVEIPTARSDNDR